MNNISQKNILCRTAYTRMKMRGEICGIWCTDFWYSDSAKWTEEE
jgi:hypothetical protein